ncbi:MAG TPA: MerR family transcriptional regulator [Egibacteraceae bacterium]|jgi:MerR family transcriptional regulator, heat shock protein HspR|nr:MerR family transcriptional regulator [Egibacteraceae bacterium]
MSDDGHAVYIISVAAELAGVHPQTLRTYERKGLIEPERTAGGTRRYSQRDVDRVRLIQELTRGEGVNLAGVLRILELQDRLELAERRLLRARAEAERVREEARRAVRRAAQRSGAELTLYRPTAIERYPRPSRRSG